MEDINSIMVLRRETGPNIMTTLKVHTTELPEIQSFLSCEFRYVTKRMCVYNFLNSNFDLDIFGKRDLLLKTTVPSRLSDRFQPGLSRQRSYVTKHHKQRPSLFKLFQEERC